MLSNTHINTFKSKVAILLWVLFLFFGKVFSQTSYYVGTYTAGTSIYVTTGTVAADVNGAGLSASYPAKTLSGLWGLYGPAGTHTATAKIANGDIIYVDAGTYTDISSTGNIFNLNIGVSIVGAGMGATIFKAAVANSYAFMTVTSQSVTLQDFSITSYGADASASGGCEGFSFTTSTVTINAVLITSDGGSGSYYAPIYINNSIVTINEGGVGCTANLETGGGIDIVGSSTVTISNFLFYKNIKFGYEAITNGAALSITGGSIPATSVTVSNCNFTGNNLQSSGGNNYGGAIYISAGYLSISNSIISSNTITSGDDSYYYGGGLAIAGSSSVVISGCTFSSNTVSTGLGTNYGGAISISGTPTVSISATTFSANSADANNGSDIYSSATNSLVTVTTSSLSSPSKEIVAANGTITVTNSGTPTKSGTVNESGGTSSPTAPTVVTATACATNGSNFILPIVLIEFIGQCTNNQTTLVWQTATQTNNKVFDIEKSLDGNNFSVIGTVKGAGNSTETLNYAFVDKNAKEGIAYYRLTQIDFNGKSSQSNIITVNSCAPAIAPKINIYPNPAIENFNVDFTLFQTSQVTIDILNELGQVVKTIPTQSLESGIQILKVDVSGFSPGVYFLKITINNSPETIHKLIKI